MSLATKYRPQTFADVVEQNITTAILEKQIQNRTFKNCYGFFGTSGTGKTSLARVFALAINRGVGEPIEIDGATAGSTENIKNIVEAANTRSLTGEYKIFIIDECQMLGGGRKENSPAWAALLKCLEDCPAYTIFIFCSTNPEKIPDAIMNRIQRYNFMPISQQGIKNRLIYICQQEGFTNYEMTCDFISKISHGGMRDAIAFLEQVADYSKDLDINVAKKIIGGLSYEVLFKLTWAIQKGDQASIIAMIEDLYNNGQDLRLFINTYLDFVLDLIKYVLFKDPSILMIPEYLASEGNNAVAATVDFENSLQYFNKFSDKLLELKTLIRTDNSYKSTIEIFLVKTAVELGMYR